MTTQFFKRSLFGRIIACIIIANFILTGIPISAYSSSRVTSDNIRGASALKTGNPGRSAIIDDLKVDLHARAIATIAKMPDGTKIDFHRYNEKKGGYVVEQIDKKRLEKLLVRDEVGLIEDEDNAGQYIWANKIDGAVVTKNGDLFISGRITYPTLADTPINRINLNRYTKIVPLAYQFFREYLGKGEYAWISDILANSKVLLVASGSLGDRRFSVDKATRTIRIEKDFMDYRPRFGLGWQLFGLFGASQKRVAMGLFAEAAIELSDKKIDPQKAKEIVNKIAQVSLTGNNRLEDAIYLFNLKKEIDRQERKLTASERQYFLIDMMERNRGFNGRRAAQILKEAFAYYGKVTPKEAEADLRAIAQAHTKEVVVEPYDPEKVNEEDRAAKYTDRTDNFRLTTEHIADLDLIKDDRKIVLDVEVDARDAGLFGGKVVYTGMMIWAPHENTLPMFATAGNCFKIDLIGHNKLRDEFVRIDKKFQDDLRALEARYGKNSKDEAFVSAKLKLSKDASAEFQKKLSWDVVKVPDILVQEIKEGLKDLAKRTGTSVFQLILAIRSSAIGEDSEANSFAGRQDTALFVTPLRKAFEDIGLTPEKYGYNPEELRKSVLPWYEILDKARKEIGDRVVTDDMLNIFIKEWVANQRSLFNYRSIEYRIEKGIPVFTDDVEMSSVFQQQGNTVFGYVAFGVNRSTGYPEAQVEIIEGQGNAIVSGKGTPDSFNVAYFGRDAFRQIQVPPSRKFWHVPNIFKYGKAENAEGEPEEGVVSLDFPKEMEGKPVTTDMELLRQIGEADISLTKFFGMFSDIEGGFVYKRDVIGNTIFVEDPDESDGIAKENSGKPRKEMIKFQTQIRPETRWNFKNPSVVEQHWLELPDDEYQRAVREGKVLYGAGSAQGKTQGAAKGEVFIVEKNRPETWARVVDKIMVTLQSDPDMNAAMRMAKAVIAAVGGNNSHTMIVANEYGLIAISGIGDIDKFYDGQKVTVDATRGVILAGDDYKLTPAGKDYNTDDLGKMPTGFGLSLNINSAELAQKGRAARNKPDFKGIGLDRLEFLLEKIGGAGEGILRYDSYKIYTLLEKLDKGELTASDKFILNRMFRIKGDISHLRAYLRDDDKISAFVDGTDRIYDSGLEFYRAHVQDQEYPRYNPEIPAELRKIKEFDALITDKGFILGEERYIDIMYRGIKSKFEPLMVDPLEFLILAQSIKNQDIRHEALAIAEEYNRTYLEEDNALPTDELIKKIEELAKSYEGVITTQEKKLLLDFMKRHLQRDFYIRFDDRKSDEYAGVLGSTVIVDRNPMMGYRGIRLMLDHPKVTRMQLEAIKRVVDIGARLDTEDRAYGKGKYRMRVFSPIVYDAEHPRQMNALCDEAGLTEDRVKRGIMTETPQSAEIRPFLAALIDFISVGGNDMYQGLKEFERQLARAYFNAMTERNIESFRVLATLANEIKRWNREKRIPFGLEPITASYCGNWPAADPIGGLILYLYGFDSASITLPSLGRTDDDIYDSLDFLYGHDELGLLNVPEDKEEIVQKFYQLIADNNMQDAFKKFLENRYREGLEIIDPKSYEEELTKLRGEMQVLEEKNKSAVGAITKIADISSNEFLELSKQIRQLSDDIAGYRKKIYLVEYNLNIINDLEARKKRLIDMLPTLKIALDQRNFSIYDQINPDANPEIRTAYAKGSISAAHLGIPLHYQLLAEYDKGEAGELFVQEAAASLYEKIASLRAELKDYEAKFVQLKKEVSESKGKVLDKELSNTADEIEKRNKETKEAGFKIKSIELRAIIEKFLTRARYDINQPGVGKQFYIDNLKQLWRQQAQDAKQRGELFIVETAKEPSDYLRLKLGGERYEGDKEPNPQIGDRGMKKNLNPDRNIFAWDLQAIKELRAEGLDNIALALSKVREVPEVDDALSLLKEAGLEDIPLGMVENSPSNIYAFEQYFIKERRISFVLLDREAQRELAEAKRLTEFDNVNATLITDKDVDASLGDVTIPVTKAQAANFSVQLYLVENPTNKAADIYRFNKIIAADRRVHSGNFSAEYTKVISALKDLKEGIVTKPQVEKAGLNWNDVSEKLIKNGWAQQINPKEIRLTANLKEEEGRMSGIFGDDFLKILPILQQSQDRGKGAAVISAGALFKNAGSLDALLEFKGANPNFKIAVWAKDQSEFDKAMNIGELSDILSIDLDTALNELNSKGIATNITVVGFEADREEISKVIKPGVKALIMQMPKAKEEAKINVMSLVLARAIAGTFQNEETVVEKFNELTQNYKASGKISEQDLAVVNDLTAQISTVPLVLVQPAIADAAQIYETTSEELGGEV